MTTRPWVWLGAGLAALVGEYAAMLSAKPSLPVVLGLALAAGACLGASLLALPSPDSRTGGS